MENKKTWKDSEVEKLEDLFLYVDHLSEVDDGSEEGKEIVKTHQLYQNKIKAILKEIISSYYLYKDFDSFDDNDSYRDKFRYKFDAISSILLASSDVEAK